MEAPGTPKKKTITAEFAKFPPHRPTLAESAEGSPVKVTKVVKLF